MFRLSVLVLALLSAGCVSLDPTYQRRYLACMAKPLLW